MSKQVRESFDTTGLLVFLFSWRKPILLLTALGAVASIAVSLAIPNKYKSTVILFPSTTSSVSKALLSQNPGQKDDILRFGEEEDAEQMLQILHSSKIRDRIIQKYDLMNHYEIDPDGDFKMTDLYREYESNITFERTEFMSVKVEVLDTDPLKAANIANDIAALYDSTMSSIKKERAKLGLHYVETTYRKISGEIKKTQDSLDVLMKLGVNDYESQAERLNEALGKAILEGKTAAANMLRDQLKQLAQYGQAYVSLRDNLEFQRKQLSEIKTKYDEAKLDYEENLPDKFVVDYAYPAEKKSYPVRWIIVTVSTGSTFLISILGIIMLESFQRVRRSLLSKVNPETNG
ncbi:MAG: hypothetical protein IT233_01155 [Bacteroidia bacterium]|nr:hypothetical protein [Bacteroidia bacterium]